MRSTRAPMRDVSDQYFLLRLSAFLLAATGVFLFLCGQVSPAAAETRVGGPITTNTTWDVAGSPYIVYAHVQVLEGATLTIRPGVEVRFDTDKALVVDTSTLIAEGRADSMIVFKRNGAQRWGVICGYAAQMTFRYCRVEWGWFHEYITLHEGLISNAVGNTIVEDCILSHAGFHGTEFEGGSVVFRRNLIEFSYRQGFDCWDHCNTTIEDCRVVNCNQDAYSITTVNGAEIVFRNNVAIDIGDDGLDIDHFGYTRVGPFEAYNCNDKGVSVSFHSTSVVVENTVVADATEAFTATANSNISVFNCVAYNCDRAFSAYEKWPYAGGAQIYVASSIAWNTTTPVYLDSLSSATVFYSILDTPEPYPGLGNLNTDPRFVNADNFIFSLAPDSPAIDSGWSDGTPVVDILGHARVDVPAVPNTGGGPFRYYDMGAYEFIPQTTAVVGPAPAARFGLKAFPSPATGPVAIAFDLPERRDVDVAIYDAAGRLIQRLFSGALEPGRHDVSWQANARAPHGIYFVRLRAGAEEAVEKVVRAP